MFRWILLGAIALTPLAARAEHLPGRYAGQFNGQAISLELEVIKDGVDGQLRIGEKFLLLYGTITADGRFEGSCNDGPYVIMVEGQLRGDVLVLDINRRKATLHRLGRSPASRPASGPSSRPLW